MTRSFERTSARVAKIAGRVLAIRSPVNFLVYKDEHHRIMWGDVLALAASALTQAADHSDRETIRSGKLPKGHRRIKVHTPIARNGKARG